MAAIMPAFDINISALFCDVLPDLFNDTMASSVYCLIAVKGEMASLIGDTDHIVQPIDDYL